MNRKGYTLVELLITVAIVGILGFILMTAIGGCNLGDLGQFFRR